MTQHPDARVSLSLSEYIRQAATILVAVGGLMWAVAECVAGLRADIAAIRTEVRTDVAAMKTAQESMAQDFRYLRTRVDGLSGSPPSPSRSP